tara:strand:+ start:117 stop:332 length:216 start_codon:yes stop_codon:yes gene_type:complete
MEVTLNTAKKYDYKLTITKVGYPERKETPFQVHGRYIRANGEAIYNETVRYFKNYAASIRFYMKKMDSVRV